MVPRVLLVHEPPDGGVAQHVTRLALALGDHGVEVEVAAPAGSTTATQLEGTAVPFHAVGLARTYSRPDRDARAAGELREIVRKRGIGIVHSHSSKAGVLGRLAARATRVHSIYTPHCFAFVGRVSHRRRLAATVIERALGRTTDAIICVSEAERRRALERRVAAPERLHTILNGVPACNQAIPPDSSLQALRRGGPLVGMVTVMRLQKRVDVFLEAIPLIWRSAPRARFAIVGQGPLAGELHAQARALGLNEDERVLFTGFEEPSDRYLKALDLFALTSDWEAMSIGLLEAMACGVPQVVTDVDGCAEAVGGRTGLLVEPGNPAAFAEAVVGLLGDPSRRRFMEQASRAQHRELFTEERMIRQTAALYHSVLRIEPR